MILDDYHREIYIAPRRKLGKECYAYCMDGFFSENRGKPGDMAHDVGLPSCHCCDYFMLGENAISFLEISDLEHAKEKFDKGHPDYSKKLRGEIFRKDVATENLLKLYGSLLVLCWFASLCHHEKERLRPKNYHFFLIVPRASKNMDARMLSRIEQRLQNKMGGVAPGFKKVQVVYSDKFRQKVELYESPPA